MPTLIKMSKSSLPRLGIYGPRPPQKTGVARYVQESMPHLARSFVCTLLAEDDWRSPDEFDQVLYHIGNNVMHDGAFRALRKRSGPVILHEYNNLGYYYQVWNELPNNERRQLLDFLGDALGRSFPDRDELDRYFTAHQNTDRYSIDAGCERVVIESATVVFVHSDGVAEVLRARYPASCIEVLPFPVTEIKPARDIATRQLFGIRQDAFVFGVFGFIGKYKRIESILSAWEYWGEGRPSNAVLLLVGERQYDIKIPSSLLIRETGYVSDDDFDALLLATDCGVQLRYPCLGETSGPACALIAHGRSVILSDIPEMHSLAGKGRITYVPVGAGEVEALTKAMQVQYFGRRRAVGYDESFAWATWAVALTSRLLASSQSSTQAEGEGGGAPSFPLGS
jgi:glycosyltransferase involved in cell wall biosynthesis